MIEVICNDRLGKKIRVKCNPDDTVGDLKKLLAAQATLRRPPPSGLTSPERAAHLPVEHPPSTSHPGPADGHAAREAAHPKVVHGVQGPHQLGRLRDPRRHGPRALLQLGAGIRGGPSSVGAARHRFEQRGLKRGRAEARWVGSEGRGGRRAGGGVFAATTPRRPISVCARPSAPAAQV